MSVFEGCLHSAGAISGALHTASHRHNSLLIVLCIISGLCPAEDTFEVAPVDAGASLHRGDVGADGGLAAALPPLPARPVQQVVGVQVCRVKCSRTLSTWQPGSVISGAPFPGRKGPRGMLQAACAGWRCAHLCRRAG
jgi:hypothetical protein